MRSRWRLGLEMGGRLPVVVCRANRWAAELLATFETTIDPILAQYILADPVRGAARARILPASIKGAFLIRAYATLIGQPVSPAIAVTAGAFTRIYDDVVDETTDPALGQRLMTLFGGGPFEPAGEIEAILLALYRTLDVWLPVAAFPTCRQALLDLHEVQIRSLAQRTGIMPRAELLTLTAHKGASALQVLFGIVRGDMSGEERALVGELGACFQLIDDYEDWYKDKQQGVATSASEGLVSIDQINERIADLSAQLVHYYGSEPARPLVTYVYYWAAVARVVRSLRSWRLLSRGETSKGAGRPRVMPIRVLFG